ncbi:hypothetical protein [Embleya sp. AB8]|uniref:hypothetical protein n=1 Tax=Embleya sp. AB8 TaxID=3156304 RepID=UPI003C765B44
MVAAAEESARARGFAYSCEPEVGRLLAVLAVTVPPRRPNPGTRRRRRRGLDRLRPEPGRRVAVTTIERAAERAARNAQLPWLAHIDLRIDFRVRDNEQLLPTLGTFDLIFADAAGGKRSGLAWTLRP